MKNVIAFVAAVAALTLAAAPRVLAQQLRGTVSDSTSRQVIPGAVILLLDSAGHVLSRTLGNQRGEYAAATTRDVRRVRAIHIGFQPRELRLPVEPTEGELWLDIRMTSIPTLLEPVTVIDQPKCPARRDRAAALGLWENARAALLATVVARESNPPRVTRLNFDRHVDGQRILGQTVRIDSAATAQPFVASRSATDFLADGFKDDSAGVWVYHSPDAQVLLDDAFVYAHCFRIDAPDNTRPGAVGLGFTPADRKNDRVDIEGTVWIDTARRVLTDLTYRYVGLGARYDRYDPGGQVSFRSMDDGSAIVDRWFIHLVTVRGKSRGTNRNTTLEVHERGGEVMRAVWPDGRSWQGSLGTVRGIALLQGARRDGARIRLLGTDYESTTDSAGIFAIPNLLPGPYRIGVVDPRLDSIGITINTGIAIAAQRDSVSDVTFTAPTTADYARSACRAAGLGMGLKVLIGRAILPDGSPADGATFVIQAENLEHQVIAYSKGTVSSDGIFQFCDAPADKALTVSLELGSTLRGFRLAGNHDAIELFVVRLTAR